MRLLNGGRSTSDADALAERASRMGKKELAELNAQSRARHETTAAMYDELWQMLRQVPDGPTSGLLPLSEVARILGLPARLLRQRIHKGTLPAVRLGAHWRIHRVEVLRQLVKQWEVPFRPLRLGARVVSGCDVARLVGRGTPAARGLKTP